MRLLIAAVVLIISGPVYAQTVESSAAMMQQRNFMTFLLI
jgi:hypothetical protein